MRKLLSRLSERQKILAVAAASVLLIILAIRVLLAPAWRDSAALKLRLAQLNAEHSRLAANLSLRSGVDAEFTRLPPDAFESASDQLTLSAWLRRLEALARRPGMLLGNMKAQPVKRERHTSIYTVRLAVSGRLQEVLQFIADATDGGAVTGIDAFTVRGVQGANAIECGMTLRMVCLPTTTQVNPAAKAAPASAADRRGT